MPTPRSTPRFSSRATADAKLPLYALTRAASRRVDGLAQRQFGIPTLLLMESAGRHVAEVALEMVESIASPRVLVVAGPGNNGGDGLVAARHLHNAGIDVRVLTLTPASAYADIARVNLTMAQRLGIPITATGRGAGAFRTALRGWKTPDLLIDALVGTGLARDLDGRLLELVIAINAARRAGAKTLSVDIPSGMEADTGLPRPQCIQADTTITFAALKVGFLAPEAAENLGEVVVADIGIPAQLLARVGRPLTMKRKKR